MAAPSKRKSEVRRAPWIGDDEAGDSKVRCRRRASWATVGCEPISQCSTG